MRTAGGLVLLGALAVAVFGQGAFFSPAQWLVAALVAVASVLALGAGSLSRDDLGSGVIIGGAALGVWAVVRSAAAGTPAAGLAWALFGAGTAAVVFVCGRLDSGSRETLLGGVFAIGAVVALTGWLGVAFHHRSWGLPAQGLWRASSTLTYANATAALLVPVALVALTRLAAAPRSAGFSLTTATLLTGAGATLSRAGVAAFAAGLVVACLAAGARVIMRAAIWPVAGAGVALLGLVPSLPVTAPARPLAATAALAAGMATAVFMPRVPGRALRLPAAAAALVAMLTVISFAPDVHGAMRALGAARFNLASSNRAGEAATALRMIARHPLAGVGPGHGTLRWTGSSGGLHVDRYDHDEYLQVLTDLGVIGAALLAFFAAAAARLLWRARTAVAQQAAWAGAVAAVTAFAVHSGFDFLWQIPAIPLTVAVLAGVTVPSTTRARAPAPAANRKEEP